jgi:nickel-dependent lactate racemase
MASNTVRVPQMAFFGDTELELEFPDSWKVTTQAMPGHDLPVLCDDEIRAALAHPIGSPTLRDLARGKHEAVIIFDDISRPTPIDRLWPFVVEELHAAGITDSHIRMIVAAGLHGAHSREDFRRKLGEEALRRFPVFNHNPFENCTEVGITRRGTPVQVNNEVLACDVRVGIGAIVPHGFAGYGGGPKIVLPGIVSLNTIRANHGPVLRTIREEGKGHTLAPGHVANVVWQDIAETAKIARLDFKVDAILNERRGVVGLFAGDCVKMWHEGVKTAETVYKTDPALDAEVVVSNGYGKGNEVAIAAMANHIGAGVEKDMVAIATCPQGQVVHYLYGDFGDHCPGSLAIRPLNGDRRSFPPGIRRMILLTPYPEQSAWRFYASTGKPFYQVGKWAEAMELLRQWHPDGARAAVYPDLTIQYIDPVKAMARAEPARMASSGVRSS